VDAVRRAVHRDGQVTTRSAFVGVALASAPWPGARSNDAPGVLRAGAPPVVEITVQASPMARLNPSSGAVGGGIGGELRFAAHRAGGQTFFHLGVMAATVSWTQMTAQLTHGLIAFEVGGTRRIGNVDLRAGVGAVHYTSSVKDGASSTSASEWSASLEASAGFHVGAFEIGTGVRILSGPTVWISPLYGAVNF
jgi:hypothetical protein